MSNELGKIAPYRKYEYTILSNVAYVVVLLSPIVVLLSFYLTNDEHLLPSSIFFGLAVLLSPLSAFLLIKHFTFSLIFEKNCVRVKWLGGAQTICLDEIISVQTKKMNLVLESVYVRDKHNRHFNFERGLANYKHIKKILVNVAASNVTLDDEIAIGFHPYRAGYKMTFIGLLLGIFLIILMLFPYQVIAGEVRRSDFEAIVFCLILLAFIIPNVIVFAGDLLFVLKVDEDRVSARRFGIDTTIDFTNVEKLSVSNLLIETLTVVNTSSRKIDFHKYLQNYENVKRYLTRKCT